jgi:hypothetical protein
MRARGFIVPALILTAGLLCYQNSRNAPFVLDDDQNIVTNHRIRSIFPMSETIGGSTRPLVVLSLAVNYRFGKLDVRGYHGVNTAIHLTAGLVLYGLARRTLELSGGRCQSQAAPLAGAIALLWTLHPLQTQSVTYVVQRAESMMGLFYLLTLYAFIRSREKSAWSPGNRFARSGFTPRSEGHGGTEQGSASEKRLEGVSRMSESEPVAKGTPGWLILSAACCALGMASKPIMATAPAMVLLYDRTFLSGSFRKALRARRGFYIGLAATWLIPLWLLSHPHESQASAGFGIREIAPLEYLATQPGVLLHYLRLAFWPHPLCLDYLWPVARGTREILFPATVILLLLAATLWGLLRRSRRGFLGAWFFGILAPSSSVIPIADPAFEHRMYLPLAAVIATAVLVVKASLDRLFPGRPIVHPLMLGAAAIALGWGTVRRNEDYRSARVLWEDTARERPDNHRALTNLGMALAQEGKAEEARRLYERALEIEPSYLEALTNLGNLLARQGKPQEALPYYQKGVQTGRPYANLHFNLANVLLELGRTEEAIRHYREAARIDPHDPGPSRMLDQLGIR